MRERRVGIVIEISSKKQYLGKFGEGLEEHWLANSDGHITYCIVLPQGRVFDNIAGLKFQIDFQKGDEKENVFYFPWERILEVRTLDGRPIYRNWYLCPKCRRITKFFLKRSGPFCRHCEHPISTKENRETCISPLEDEL